MRTRMQIANCSRSKGYEITLRAFNCPEGETKIFRKVGSHRTFKGFNIPLYELIFYFTPEITNGGGVHSRMIDILASDKLIKDYKEPGLLTDPGQYAYSPGSQDSSDIQYHGGFTAIDEGFRLNEEW